MKKGFTFIKFARKGFTLIELLVVVLIIGILAAIAVPQYQKAVEKSRATEALTNVRTIAQAMRLSKMATGVPAQKLDELDIALPGEKINDTTVKLKYFTIDIRINPRGPEGFEVVATPNDVSSNAKNYYIYFDYMGGMSCISQTTESAPICVALCGKLKGTDPSRMVCALS